MTQSLSVERWSPCERAWLYGPGAHQALETARGVGTRLDWPSNLWMGVSIENAKYRFRIDHLPSVDAAVRALEANYPGRDCLVTAGDCNQTIVGVLKELSRYNWAPTFAFVDPNGPDVHWSSLQALASFKKLHLTKPELWVLLAAGMFIRTLPVDGQVRLEDATKLTLMYGTEQWRAIVDGTLRPAVAREEYVNLMRWRLEHVLGYQWTHPIEIVNERGHSIYHMIFATDHPAGDRIMTSLYNAAANEFPVMREDARRHRERLAERAAGIQSLFDDASQVESRPWARGRSSTSTPPPGTPFGTGDAH